MAKSIQIILSIFLVSSILLNSQLVQAKDIPERDKLAVEFWIQSFKGLWTGFYKGFYNNARPLSESCLGNDSK